jgi:hypothetical protein
MRGLEVKRRFGYYVGSAAAVLVALSMVVMPASAQDGKGSKESSKDEKIHALPPGGPTPRLKDGHPDFSGVWYPNSAGQNLKTSVLWDASKLGALGAEVTQQRGRGAREMADAEALRQFDPKVTPQEKPSFQPWAAAKIKAMSATESQLGSTHIQCLPRGVPAIFTSNSYPIQFVSTPGQLVMLVELLNNFRVLHTDGRAHNPDPDPLFNGDGVGHWEGDTLVVDTISLDERNEGVGPGWIHSDQEHLIERLSRPSKNYVIYQVTVEDPKVLTKPWTSAPRRWTLAQDNYDIAEYYCTHNEEVSELSKVKENESAGNLKK